MYYTTDNALNPTAHITKKRSRLKIYGGENVYLKDKDNFEIEMHNPTTKKILCKIKLNGNYISDSGIVLRPGQRVFLERFLDSNNKFEFSTYEVKNTTENLNAISLNGDVSVEFYDEQLISNRTYTYYHNPIIGTTTIHGSAGTYSNSTVTLTSNSVSDSLGFTTSSMDQRPRSRSFGKKSIETGTVEKGSSSDQSFTRSYDTFNHYSSHVVRYKILPESAKNISVEEIRNYCPECGTKVKKNYKFCPTCGNKI